eukprot:TRINITY_DN14564_c0_g1_i1.p1 TRINITY_DN14564_c0_g1~~TRINITY_DN14564_c0_g1_i1.p1  ORF type:complete len:583 (-),score=114.26 TRINITY_DN14564_c0_g1_i1:247-1947(-)
MEDSDSFVICDCNSNGFPIRYVSQGFEELYGYDADECAGRNCGQLVGGSSLLEGGDEDILHKAAAAADITDAEAMQAVRIMAAAAGEAARRSVTGGLAASAPCESLLLLNRRKDGSSFVCEMSLCRNEHPTLAWSYQVGVQRDVTNELPVSRLLREAAKGADRYNALCENWRSRHATLKEGNLTLALGASPELLHAAAKKTWTDVLSSGLKAKKGSKSSNASRTRSLASVSTTCSSQSAQSSWSKASDSTGIACFHLGGLVQVGANDHASIAEEEHRFHDLLESLSPRATTTRKSMLEGRVPDVPHLASLWRNAGQRPTTVAAEPDGFLPIWENRFLDLLENADFTDAEEDTLDQECTGLDGSSTFQDVVQWMSHPSLQSFDFSLVIADPSFPGIPIVACSRGYWRRSGVTKQKIIGQALETTLGEVLQRLHVLEIHSKWHCFCDAAVAGEFCPGSCISDAEENLPKLSDGEFAILSTGNSTDEDSRRCLLYFKQVELDDRMVILALRSALPQEAADVANGGACSGWQLALHELNKNLDETVNALTAEFFFCAPMRRQAGHVFWAC